MKYPIGVQDFEKVITGGFVYVDKTELVYRLVTTGSYYFLSRPRRFGKSLLVSTLEAYFKGKRELFKGLAVDELEREWIEYPVLHLDLNTGKYDNKEALYNTLNLTLMSWESIYGASAAEVSPELRFLGIVRRAFEQTGRRVVILIDEYDKPLLQAIGNDELQDEYRSILRAFYSVLKTQDRYIRFGLLTGVTKFGKLSVFSDLNNLEDISMRRQWSSICGITEEEIHRYFEPAVRDMAAENGYTYEETLSKLEEMYDGYHFCNDTVGVYNPFSLLNALKNKVFEDYWFETGTPLFLVKCMQRTNYNLNDLSTEEQSADSLNSIDAASVNPVPLIYQSGYLTIKDYDKEFKLYKLGYPNKEVENGFVRYLLPYYTPTDEKNSEFFIRNFVLEVRKGKPEAFMERLKTMFADQSYTVMGQMELYFQNSMYVIFKILGFYSEVERTTNRGRIDLVIKTKDFIYIIEIKLDGTAADALRQINEKGYAEPYAKDGRKLFKIGVNFSSETKGIAEWTVEE